MQRIFIFVGIVLSIRKLTTFILTNYCEEISQGNIIQTGFVCIDDECFTSKQATGFNGYFTLQEYISTNSFLLSLIFSDGANDRPAFLIGHRYLIARYLN